MAEARRKTTLTERKEIVEYCIAHNRDYKGTASLYEVSYSQVYSWVRKYDAVGEDGLSDKRGHHKTDDEVDELERLQAMKYQLDVQTIGHIARCLSSCLTHTIRLSKIIRMPGRFFILPEAFSTRAEYFRRSFVNKAWNSLCPVLDTTLIMVLLKVCGGLLNRKCIVCIR